VKADTPGEHAPRAGVASWRASPWLLLAVLTLVNASNWAERQVVPILFPGIREELALSDTQLGVIGGVAFSFIYAISSFAFGRAADRSLRRTVIVVGLVLRSLATASGGLATGFGSLFAARFLTGIGEASLFPAAMSLLAERFPAASRGRAMGIFGSAAALGGGLGVALGGLLAEHFGWRSVFVVYGVSGFVLVPFVLGVPESRRSLPDSEKESARDVVIDLLGDVRLLVLWAAGTLTFGAGMAYSAWVPSFLVREHGFQVAQAGYVFGLAVVVGGVAGSLLGGFAADRAARRRLAGQLDVSVLAALIAFPCALASVLTSWAPAYITFAILTPVAVFAFFPAMQTMLVEIVPAHRHGLAYAVNILFLGGIGSAFGPYVIGAISDATHSLRFAVGTTAIGIALGGMLIALAGRLVRAEPRRAER